MAMYSMLFSTLLALLSIVLVLANDPSPLQDICVADPTKGVFMNGMVCKDLALVVPDDFTFSGLQTNGSTTNTFFFFEIPTTNTYGSSVNMVDVQVLPGLNTLGVAMARLDVAAGGVNPPHIHPRASEVITVLDGRLYVGFIDTGNRLFARVLNKGDVFVFPKGLLHFQYNYGPQSAFAIAGFNSQNPGVINLANSVFASNPAVPDEILSKAFQISTQSVQSIKAPFKAKN